MADKTLFIHAGGSKTGSSALQSFFYNNASQLDIFDFAYENRHTYEFGANNGMLLYNVLSSATTTNNEIDGLVLSYFGQSNRALCSSEYFQLTETRGWRKLLESLNRLGVELKVIYYVRNVIPFFLSSYDQGIKYNGVWILFDEWVIKQDWQHASGLRMMANELPQSSIQVLNFDHEKANLIRGFLDILGIDPSFKVDQYDQRKLVNRSLNDVERKALIAINKVLGKAYSAELFKLLSHVNPNVPGEPVSYQKATTELLLARYSNEVDWVNNTFFNGQAVVSVLPIDSKKKTQSNKSIIKPMHNNDIEKRVLDWALENRLVNRSLSEEERKAFIAVNKALGEVCSSELSDLLIHVNPNVQRESASYFNDQAVASVLPIDSKKKTQSNKSIIEPLQNNDVEKRVLDWALEKLKTIQDETKQRKVKCLLNKLKSTAQNDSEKFHPGGVPPDFDAFAYLVLNPDVLRAGVDPIQHFITHGMQEGRAYRFLKRRI